MKHVFFAACLLIATQAVQSAESTKPSPAKDAASAPKLGGGMSGKVVETMNAGEYTYVLVDTGAKKAWAAAPRFTVKPGDSVEIADSMPMPNYHSKTLNRDFDVVHFAGGVVVNGVKPASTTPELPQGHPPIGAPAAPAAVAVTGVKKADGGKTIAEIYAEKTKLSGKQVKIRGKVVKYNAQIMGKNWVHIRDGSGTEGSNDLLVTTSSPTKVGDTILVTGTVAINKDFTAGYKYPVLIEDAKVTAE